MGDAFVAHLQQLAAKLDYVARDDTARFSAAYRCVGERVVVVWCGTGWVVVGRSAAHLAAALALSDTRGALPVPPRLPTACTDSRRDVAPELERLKV